MKYFQDFQGKFTTSDGTEIINLLESVKLDNVLNAEYYISYTLSDGEDPTTLAYNLYDDEELWWIAFLVNDIVDPFYDWPMSNKVLREYFNYLVENSELQGTTSDWSDIVTWNNNKRTINVLDPRFLGQFLYVVEGVLNAR